MTAMRHVTVRIPIMTLRAIDLAVKAESRRYGFTVSRNYWIVKTLREASRSKRDE